MNWRTIRYALMVLLIALNAGLFIYSSYLKRERYVVPEERIATIREQYAGKGYTLPETLPREQYPKAGLRLSKKNLESRADSFWSGQYEKSYMIGSKILYTHGTETLMVDRDTSSMIYTQAPPGSAGTVSEEEGERIALAFAERMLKSENPLCLFKKEQEDGGLVYLFCESYEETPVFCNRVRLVLRQGQVQQAEMIQYTIEGYETHKQYIYPVDEVLSLCLRELPETEDEELMVFFGYETDTSDAAETVASPGIMILREDGNGLMADQYTVTINNLYY